MNEIIQNDAEQSTESERNILVIAYVLHVIGPFTAFLLNIAGVVVNHIRAAETHNHFIRSHHAWMLRTFWWTLLWSVISGILCVIVIGYAGFFIAGIWWVYRVVRGLINYASRRPMPA